MKPARCLSLLLGLSVLAGLLAACQEDQSPQAQRIERQERLLTSYKDAIRLAKDYQYKRLNSFYGKQIFGSRRNGDTISYWVVLRNEPDSFGYHYWSKSPKLQQQMFTEMLDKLKHDTTDYMSKLRLLYPGVSDSLAARRWMMATDSLVNLFQPIATKYGFYRLLSKGPYVSFFSNGGSLLYADSDSASVAACAELLNWERSHTRGYDGAWTSTWTFHRLNEHFTFYYPSDTLRLDE